MELFSIMPIWISWMIQNKFMNSLPLQWSILKSKGSARKAKILVEIRLILSKDFLAIILRGSPIAQLVKIVAFVIKVIRKKVNLDANCAQVCMKEILSYV